MALYKILANNPYAISDIIILIGQLNDWLFACAVLMKQTLCRLNGLFRNISFVINEIMKMKFLENSFYKELKNLFFTTLYFPSCSQFSRPVLSGSGAPWIFQCWPAPSWSGRMKIKHRFTIQKTNCSENGLILHQIYYIYRVSQKRHFQNAVGATVHWLNLK